MDLHRSVSRLRKAWRDTACRFSRGFTWALSSNIVYYACQWGIVLALARLGTPADVGAYALGMAVTSPVLMLAGFQARNLVASDVRNVFLFGDYVTFRVVSLGAALVLISAVTYLAQHARTTALVILFVGVAQASDCVSDTYFGLLQRHDRLDRVSISLMIKGPLCLILVGTTMWATHSVVLAVMSLVIGRLFVLSIIDIRSGLDIGGPHRFTWNWQVQRRLLVTALPFGIISCLGVLNMNIPRYFIEYDLSRHDLGIFSAVASLVGSGNLIIAALASCAIVPLANAWANQHTHEYNALYRRFIAASVAMGMGGVLIALLGGDRILKLLFSADYVGNSGVLARVMVAGALGYVVSAQGYTMTAARKVREQIPALIGSSLVTGLSSWLVVPRRGLAGAAEAWILGAFFLFVYNAFLLARLSGSSHEHTRVWGDAALAGTIKTD